MEFFIENELPLATPAFGSHLWHHQSWYSPPHFQREELMLAGKKTIEASAWALTEVNCLEEMPLSLCLPQSHN